MRNNLLPSQGLIKVLICFVALIMLVNPTSAESASGTPIGNLSVDFTPEEVAPGEEVDVNISWYIEDEDYLYYQGPFNIHIDLNDTLDDSTVEDWHICNYCCGYGTDDCSVCGNCDCLIGTDDCGRDSAQCTCSSDCCDCLDDDDDGNVSDDYSCCGYRANIDNPYSYQITVSAPSEPGEYYFDVQVVASCEEREINQVVTHNTLIASEEGTLTVVPEFGTIAIPVVIALLAGLYFFRRQ